MLFFRLRNAAIFKFNEADILMGMVPQA